MRWLLQNVFFPYNSPHVIYNFFAVTISQNSLLVYLDNVLNGFFKYLIMITEFKIKCYISKIIFYILHVTGSILNCYPKNMSSFIFKKFRITNNTLYSNICYLLQIFKKDIILCL